MSDCYFLNINKPKGITSFDVIFKLRRILKIKKIGHAGTLDPMASGVMQVAVGNASRLLEYLPSDKEYIADIKFGFESTTLDIEGEITEFNTPSFSKENLESVLSGFLGKITQIPPKFSAIKVGGKKLCDIARKNPEVEIEIPKREVEIYDIELLNFNMPNAKIKVRCSKGTYIRTLALDIAKKLNTRSYLTNLTRTRAGNFELKDSIKIEDVSKKHQIPPICAIELEKYNLCEDEFLKIKNGVPIIPTNRIKGNILSLVYKDNLVSIGVLVDNKIKVKKYFDY